MKAGRIKMHMFEIFIYTEFKCNFALFCSFQSFGLESLARLSVVCPSSHLIAGHTRRRRYSSDEPLQVTTHPCKWPGKLVHCGKLIYLILLFAFHVHSLLTAGV